MDTPVEECDQIGSGRPSYSVLDNLMLRLNDIELPKPWEEALTEYLSLHNFLKNEREVNR